MRLDSYLVDRGMAVSRNKAQQLISLDRVEVNGKLATKSSLNVDDNDSVKVVSSLEFVSMGGYKLEKAIADFNINIEDNICIDVGASNGGFTHCMLGHNARRVYAVDVGECALEDAVRYDDKVIVKDRLNAREMTIDDIGEKADFISIDVSFISLTYIMYNVLNLLKDSGKVVALIKPQFEAGKKSLSKNGIVLDKKVHIKVIENIVDYIRSLGRAVTKLTYAPIREGKNIEYLILIENSGYSIDGSDIEKLVKSIV